MKTWANTQDDGMEIRSYNGKRYAASNPSKFENIFALEVMEPGQEQNTTGISIPRKVWNKLPISKG